jgi:hypothetical protein
MFSVLPSRAAGDAKAKIVDESGPPHAPARAPINARFAE